MLPNKTMMDSPIETWPADWYVVLRELKANESKGSGRFWKKLVFSHITAVPLKDDSESAYQEFFHKFWTEGRPRILSNPDGLIEAAKNGYDVYIKNWLSRLSSADCQTLLNKNGLNGDTALHAATEMGHLSTVAELLAKGAKPDAAGNLDETAMHRAAYYNFPGIVSLLLQHGASCEAARYDLDMPIHVAAMMGAVDVVNVLVNHNKDQLRATGRESRNALYIAVLADKLPVIDALLLSGCEVNLNMQTGLSALHVAASRNKPDTIKMLARHRVAIDLPDRSGFTALQRCAMQTRPALDAARALIECGAKVSAGNPTSLHFLASHASQRSPVTLEFAKLLISSGAGEDDIHNAYEFLKKRKDHKSLAPDECGLYHYLKERHPKKSKWAVFRK